MLIVVKRYSVDVEVLDTDDGTVERMNIFDAMLSGVRISGLTIKSQLPTQLSYWWQEIRHIEVFWRNCDYYEYKALTLFSETYLEDEHFKQLLWHNPVGYLVYVILIIKYFDVCVTFKGSNYILSKDDYESYLILCLYALKYDLYNQLSISLDDRLIEVDFQYIKDHCKILKWGSHILFCDDDCTVRVKETLLNRVDKIDKLMVENTKYKVINNTEVTLLTNEVIVKDCDKLVIRDDKTYLVGQDVSVNNLYVLSTDARIVSYTGKLFAKNVYIKCSHAPIVDDINNNLNILALKKYVVNKDAFDCAKIRNNIMIAGSKIPNFVFEITGIDNKKDAMKIVKGIINYSELQSVMLGGLITSTVYRALYVVQSLNKYLDNKRFDIIKYHGISVKDVSDYIMTNAGVSVSDFYLKKLEPRLSDTAYLYADEWVDLMNSIMSVVVSRYNQCAGVAKLLGVEVCEDKDYGYHVDYNIKDTDICILIYDKEEYDKCLQIDDKITSFIDKIKQKHDGLISFGSFVGNVYDFCLDIRRITYWGDLLSIYKVEEYMNGLGLQYSISNLIIECWG